MPRYRRKRKRRRTRTVRALFPLSYGPVKLNYCMATTRDPGSVQMAYYTFRANSLYDPDFTGTGHQPYGFDQMSQRYNHYTVIGAKIHVTATAKSASATSWGLVTLQTTATTGDTTLDPLTQMEAPGVRKAILGPVGTNNSRVHLSHTMSTRKFLRQNPMDEDDNSGVCGNLGTGSNPAEGIYFQLGVGPYQTGVDCPGFACNVKIEYIAIFHEPKFVGGS